MTETTCYRCAERATTATTTGSPVCNSCLPAAQAHADNLAQIDAFRATFGGAW